MQGVNLTRNPKMTVFDKQLHVLQTPIPIGHQWANGLWDCSGIVVPVYGQPHPTHPLWGSIHHPKRSAFRPIHSLCIHAMQQMWIVLAAFSPDPFQSLHSHLLQTDGYHTSSTLTRPTCTTQHNTHTHPNYSKCVQWQCPRTPRLMDLSNGYTASLATSLWHLYQRTANQMPILSMNEQPTLHYKQNAGTSVW